MPRVLPFGMCLAQFQHGHHKNVPCTCCGFRIYFFLSPNWLNYSSGNSFVLFDVSTAISHGQFHCGNRGHTQNTDFSWVKTHLPVGKRSSEIAICCLEASDTFLSQVLVCASGGTSVKYIKELKLPTGRDIISSNR